MPVITTSGGRLTWTIGGSLLLGSSALAAVSIFGNPLVFRDLGQVSDLFLALSVVVFALGAPGGGSITDRRPLGTIALVVAGVGWAGASYASTFVYDDNLFSGLWLGVIYLTIVLPSASIAMFAIAKAGGLPQPWNLAPMLTLAAALISAIVVTIVTSATPDLVFALPWLGGVAGCVGPVASAFLGTVAIVLGWRSNSTARSALQNWLAIAGGIIIGALCVIAVAISAAHPVDPDTRHNDIARQMRFPAVYAVDDSSDNPWPAGKIVLNLNGTAELDDIPSGAISSSGGQPCVTVRAHPYTGPATWSRDSRGWINVTFYGGKTMLLARSGLFIDGLDWTRVAIPDCSDEEHAFWYQ